MAGAGIGREGHATLCSSGRVCTSSQNFMLARARLSDVLAKRDAALAERDATAAERERRTRAALSGALRATEATCAAEFREVEL